MAGVHNTPVNTTQTHAFTHRDLSRTQEKDYIRTESVRLFRQSKDLTDPDAIREKVRARATRA
jgi:cell division protein FtsB